MNVTNGSNTAPIRSTVTGQLEAMLENRCEYIWIITLVYSVHQALEKMWRNMVWLTAEWR